MPANSDVDLDVDGYESWDVSPVPLPPRSRLYHLAPIGIGTSEVESLTGYLVRLAAAHCVSPFVLARREIAPTFGTERRAEIEMQLGGLMGCVARRLNGPEPEAGRWAEALTILTGRTDLHQLTMRPWAGVIGRPALLRATLAWCPACYSAWREEGREVYQPLLWSLQVVTVCARHRQPLQDRCPSPTCGRPQPIIAPAIRPGHCTACGHWLGEQEAGLPLSSPAISEQAMAWRLWVTEAVAEMLKATSLPRGPFPRGRLKEIIEECIEHLGGDGPLRGFAHLSWDTIEVWRRGASIPTLESLLRFCYYLGTTPRHLLTKGATAVALSDGLRPVTPDAPKPRRPWGLFDVEVARRAIATALADASEPLPSVAEIARQLGCAVGTLIHHLPEECRMLAERRAVQRRRAVSEAGARRCAEVRRATLAVHRQGLYPNTRRVGALLSNPLDLIRPEVREAWKAALRDIGWQPGKRKGYIP